MTFSRFWMVTLFLLTACAPHNVGAPTLNPAEEPVMRETALITPITPTLTPTAAPAPTATPALISMVCSPLKGETLSELPEIDTRAFDPSRPGFDEGHPGVDFSFYRRKDLLSIDGLAVLSALDGVVSTVLLDRLPYGHAVIIETPLDNLSEGLLSQLSLPQIAPPVAPDPKFNCQPPENSQFMNSSSRSIYILYAHLKNPVSLKVGEPVKCGQEIGAVGDSGKEYSTNPHLHFETRVGPSGARFDSMAYYTADSTETERYNYCVWRVSHQFQLFDPMRLLYAQD